MSSVSDTFINETLEHAGEKGLYRTSSFLTRVKHADALEIGKEYVQLIPQYSVSTKNRGSSVEYKGTFLGELTNKIMNTSQKTVETTFSNHTDTLTFDKNSLFLPFQDIQTIASSLSTTTQPKSEKRILRIPPTPRITLNNKQSFSPSTPVDNPLQLPQKIPSQKPTIPPVRPLPAVLQQRSTKRTRTHVIPKQKPTSTKQKPTSTRQNLLPKCLPGTRKCPIINKCVPKDNKPHIKARCKKGYRKCADNLCHDINNNTFQQEEQNRNPPQQTQEYKSIENTNVI
jgi:hypothetical protein